MKKQTRLGLVGVGVVCVMVLGAVLPLDKTRVYGVNVLPVVITIGIAATVDYMTQSVQQTLNDGNGTTVTYEPEPGFGVEDLEWDFQNLVDHFEEFRDQYAFLAHNPPAHAVAQLPEEAAHKYGGWESDGIVAEVPILSEAQAVYFPWDQMKPQLKKGDLIFSRADTAFSQVAQYFTSWVHVGVVKDVLRDQTYESFYPHGVRTYEPKHDWPAGYSWSVKRVGAAALSQAQIDEAVDVAERMYDGKPYFPPGMRSHLPRGEFVAKFADKYDTDSFYCTKLIWNVFANQGLNLDSERTTAKIENNFFHGYTDWGEENTWAWIGVSGDDLYYSKHLEPDIWTYGLANLVKPLPGWF